MRSSFGWRECCIVIGILIHIDLASSYYREILIPFYGDGMYLSVTTTLLFVIDVPDGLVAMGLHGNLAFSLAKVFTK